MKLGIALRKRRFEFQPKTRMRIMAVLMSRNSPAVSLGPPAIARDWDRVGHVPPNTVMVTPRGKRRLPGMNKLSGAEAFSL